MGENATGGEERSEIDRKRSGYNWRSALSDFVSTSRVLAGFCVTFIALILGGPVADIEISLFGVTFGQVAVLLFGISAGLFISATELFLQARGFDVFGIPEPYLELLKEACRLKKKDWAAFQDEQTKHCRHNEKIGRRCYNVAIFIMFIGLFSAIYPYNFAIAIIVSGIGIVLEAWQLLGVL